MVCRTYVWATTGYNRPSTFLLGGNLACFVANTWYDLLFGQNGLYLDQQGLYWDQCGLWFGPYIYLYISWPIPGMKFI